MTHRHTISLTKEDTTLIRSISPARKTTATTRMLIYAGLEALKSSGALPTPSKQVPPLVTVDEDGDVCTATPVPHLQTRQPLETYMRRTLGLAPKRRMRTATQRSEEEDRYYDWLNKQRNNSMGYIECPEIPPDIPPDASEGEYEEWVTPTQFSAPEQLPDASGGLLQGDTLPAVWEASEAGRLEDERSEEEPDDLIKTLVGGQPAEAERSEDDLWFQPAEEIE